MAVKTFNKNEVIFRQNEQGESFFRLLEGCVGIYDSYGEPEELKLTELSKDQFFGEMALIENYPRSATAVSLSDDTKVQEISLEELRGYMLENPDQILDLMNHLSDRLRELTDDYNDVSGVIGEMKEGEAQGRSESLKERIRKHLASFKSKKNKPAVLSEEHSYDEMEEEFSQDLYGKVKKYAKGAIICKEGDVLHCMYQIQSGRAGVYTGYGTEKEQKLTELYPNSFFGEAGMISDEPRSATVVALEPTIAELIYKEDLEILFKENPPKVEMILKHLSKRLRKLTDKYTEACALVYEAAEDEEKSGQMTPELAEKIKEYKVSLYA